MLKSRIAILDGFRGMAILFVMLFHFFSRWIPPRNEIALYPYGNDYDYFGYGWAGVQFFFIISGFVIHFTLERTDNFFSFWKKRMIRLMPSMLVASFITIFIFRFFDQDFIFPESHQFINLFPGIFFLSPALLNNIFHDAGLQFEYLSRSYWSLWPEIQFYVLVSFIFYFNKQKFLRNFLLSSLIIVMVSMGMKAILSSSILNSQVPERLSSLYLNWLWVIFGLAPFLPFFIFGVLCYDIFRRRAMGVKITVWTYVMLALIILAMLIPEKDVVTKLIYLLMVFCFLAFIYFPGKLSFFRNRYLCGIGFSSYFLYLIHEQLGVLLIYSFGQYFYPFMFIFPIILMVVLIFLSILFSEKIDKRIMTFLRKNWLQ